MQTPRRIQRVEGKKKRVSQVEKGHVIAFALSLSRQACRRLTCHLQKA
jgi:hypothetical protein